jgi:flagellar biosynthetic protein FliR
VEFFNSLNINGIFPILLVFCRVSAVFMLLPGLADSYVSVRMRTMLALLLSVIIAPILPNLPPLPQDPARLFILIMIELMVGILLGSVTKILLSTANIVGSVVALQGGLGMLMIFDPSQRTQSSPWGTFLGNLTILLLMMTDMYVMLIQAIADSYSLFVPGKFLYMEDATEFIIKTTTGSFNIAIKLAAPQLVAGLLLLLATGVIARLMPAIQIFFLVTPVQLLLSFFVLMITLSATVTWYINYISDSVSAFLLPK